MTTYVARHPFAALLVRIGNSLHRGAAVLRTLGERLDAWLATRRRAVEDRDVLAGMSDRELRDIGVSRASIDPIAEGTWMRYPH
jgi:uncharacterized protein YjiS (DUF1127 family)